MRFYFAYGSNMWVAQMNSRCPENTIIGHGILNGYRWLINTHGYATLAAAENEVVHGIVYTLSATDEQNLDDYEEVSSGLYEKCYCTVLVAAREVSCLVYIDPVTSEGRPDVAYGIRINHGLRDASFAGCLCGEVYPQVCSRQLKARISFSFSIPH